MCMTWVYRSEHFICVHNPAVLLEVSWDLSIHMFANFETKAMKSPSTTSQFEATLAEDRDAISPLKSTSSSPLLSTELRNISRNFVGNLFRFELLVNSHILLYTCLRKRISSVLGKTIFSSCKFYRLGERDDISSIVRSWRKSSSSSIIPFLSRKILPWPFFCCKVSLWSLIIL